MTTNTKTNDTNGQVRKTLASQLDRLDQILDTLGEGLNQAVATAVEQAVEAAVREGVRQGVRGALTEILTDPEVVAAIRATVGAQAADAQPEGKSGLFGQARNLAKTGAQKAGTALGAAARRVRQAAKTAWGGLRQLKPFRSQILTALGVGAAAGVGAYFAGPYVAAAAGWLAGVLSTLAVQAGVALRRLAAQANFAW